MKNSISQTIKCIAITESKKNNTMSKINKLLTLAVVTVMTLVTVSCVQDDDFSIPNSLGNEENAALQQILTKIANGDLNEVSVADVKAMYNTEGEPFRVDTDIVLKGYVSSSDKEGSFYKEIYIQDNYENPTAAIKVIINRVDLYNQFNKGREVYILLNPPAENDVPNGLYIGEERVGNGVITIGAGTETDQYGTTVTSLGENKLKASMFRSSNTMDIVPLNLSFNEVSDNHIGMFVQFDNVEFADNLAGQRYFDPFEDFDTQRTMQVCDGFDYLNFILETSSFASYKNELLPEGNGTISGVIAKNYFGDTLLLTLNSTDDVDFQGARCEVLDINDFSVVLEEDFQTAVDGTDLDLAGWINYAQAGSRVWREEVRSGDGYAEFNPFGSGDASNIVWLVTPQVDFDAKDNEILNFTSAYGYPDNGHYPMELFISNDFDGTPAGVETATWQPLSAVFSHPDVSDWWDFVSSGNVDLSSITGTAYIAFRYTGSDTNNENMTFRINDLKILGTD